MMDIKFKIPRIVVRGWDKFCDWGNVPLWRVGKYEILRLDVFNFFGLVATVVWGYYSGGYWYALLSFFSYVLVAMCALWFF